MHRDRSYHASFLGIVPFFVIAMLLVTPHVTQASELTDDEIFAAIGKQTNNFSRVRKLYVFPPGRNKRIMFVRADNGYLYLIDSAEDLVVNLQYGLPKPAKAERKMNAYRAEFAYVVKKTMQDAVREHDDKMRAKVVEIFRPKVANIQPKTISDPPPPTLESYYISYSSLKGKHNFPSSLPLTAKVKVGDNTYSLTTTLQYYSLPNMRVITR